MKKMLFVMLGVILAGYAYAQAPGAGTPTAPNALTIDVLDDCQTHPSVPYCDSPRFIQMIKEIEAGFSEVNHISCCADNTPHHRGGEGKGGKKGDEGTSKPKPWCAKLVESEFVDNYGFPKYHYPESTEMMSPCISPAYNPKDGDPCCLVPEGTKAGKGGNRGGKPNPYCSDATIGVPKCTEGVTEKCCIIPGSPQDPNAPKGGSKGGINSGVGSKKVYKCSERPDLPVCGTPGLAQGAACCRPMTAFNVNNPIGPVNP